MDKPEKSSEAPESLLTSIHGAYTLSNTNESGNEFDDVTVKNFLQTLADIAMAVASRRVNGNQKSDDGKNQQGGELPQGFRPFSN